MGRGKALKTKTKAIRKETEARLKGIHDFYKKHPQQWFGERIAQIFGNLRLQDILEIVATLGMTLVVKQVIEGSMELSSKIVEIRKTTEPLSWLWMIGSPLLATVFAAAEVTKKVEVTIEKKFDIPESMNWLIYFTFAYLIVRHFGQIMEAIGDVTVGVKTILTMLLA